MSTWGPTNITADADDVHIKNPGASEVFFGTGNDHHLAGRMVSKSTDVYHAGLRWPTVAVPQGATVSAATLVIQVDLHIGTPNVDIYGDDVDDAAAWSINDAPHDITKTTAGITAYDPGGTGSKSIDVTGIVQEWVNRPGRVSGDAFRLAFENQDSSGNNWFKFDSYSKSGGTPATLEITYTGGGYVMSIFGIESVDLAGEPRVFPRRHTGDGANYPTEEGFCGVMASLDADAIVAVRFMRLPDSMPSGSPYITLASLADAVSGAAKVKLEWAAVAMGAKPSAGPLNDEGVSTLTWSAGDDHDYKELEWQLDAAAVPAAGDIVAARFTFTAASWTLAAISTWKGWLRYK